MGIKVSILGATGNVGREFLSIIEERKFPVEELFLLASHKSEGKKILFGKKEIKVLDLNKFDFKKCELVFSSAGSKVASEFGPKAANSGCFVIDNSSYFRMDPDVPLVVPEVNSQDLKIIKKKIIANPNCSTIQMVMILKPLHDLFKIKRVVVSTYQSTSGAGRQQMDELFQQTKDIFANNQIQKKFFTKQIAFNVIPHIDSFLEDGQTKEEWKMQVETQKILDKNIQVSSTCVRVPVFVGHGESVNIEFEKEVSEDKLRETLKKSPGVSVIDYRQDEGYVTPEECAGEDKVFVSRIRKDNTLKNGISLWIVADNLRKGAALNAIQIGEELIKKKVLSK
ncbi:MAG: aspartate-semialdehyde dehydrogenase [Alphaproteobacteria bacterium]|nr:aspartate-semialdehyde dehydrogenase [Alphaproteobacteria bacterium]